jgi:hypothetical protein
MEAKGGRPWLHRRVLVVNQRTQYSLLIYILVVSAVIVGFNLLASMALSDLAQSVQPYMPLPKGRVIEVFGSIACGALVILTASIIGGLFITNKIAGPVWRLNRYMEEALRDGSRKKLSFRKGDHFPELAEKFNQLIDLIVRLEKSGIAEAPSGQVPPPADRDP